MKDKGHRVCANTVGRLLGIMGYTRQSCKKSHEGSSSPDRDEQFLFIEKTIADFKVRHQPFVSVDTKKKELVGNFRNGGSDYHPKGECPEVEIHDFIGEGGRATPYGVFDPVENVGFVNVGTCADTDEFAVVSIRIRKEAFHPEWNYSIHPVPSPAIPPEAGSAPETGGRCQSQNS